MGRVKGCVNEGCIAREKKIKFKKNNEICSECGEKLGFVCPKCYTVLDNSPEKYCIRCSLIRDLRYKKGKRYITAGAGAVAVLGGGFVLKTGVLKGKIPKL